tara:strand:- start:58 stop:552 length:495 start_codon:yes stop_codon:yes gene_type:complete
MAYTGKKIERGSSRGRSREVFKAPPIEEVIKQRNQELTDRYREQVAPDGSLNPLMIKGNLMGEEGSKINPNRQAKTQRQIEREKKLRLRAGSGQQGADIAKKKLPPGSLTDLPPFLQQILMSRPDYATLRNALKIVPMKAAQIGWEGLKIGGSLAAGALNPRGI